MITLDLSQILLFLGATLVLNLTPGADVLYIATRSLGQGKGYGVLAALGISTGLFFHVIITALGVGEIVRYCPMAFWILKIFGVCYLSYLAWKSFVAKEFIFPSSPHSQNLGIFKTYLGGVLTTILNPKVILFFLTFLPQFTNPEKGNIIFQLLFLGGLFIISGTFVNLFYVFFFSLFKECIFKSKRVAQGIQKFTGLLFATLAGKLLLAESH
ncbi:LysE family translocator [Kamptonema cortianum]|nr:LysE family translocator [Geitlerinema splendidum]MDK3161278.1 LysE family translocator [Kamptonema cortianum]